MEFEYRVADSSGKILTGTLSAESLEVAREILRKRGYLLLELKEKKEVGSRGLSFFKKIKEEDLYSFFRELAILLKSGIRIDKAFEILISSTPNPEFKRYLSEILTSLKEGKSVTESFKKVPLFNPLILSMISAGESIGNLHHAFSTIADYLRFQLQFKREIKEALTYPVFLVVASIISLIVIFKFILPRFFGIFGEASLPVSARILIFLGKLFTGKGLLLFLGLFFLIFILYRLGYLKFLSPFLKELWYRIPMLKNILLYLDLSRFSYAMHSMLKGGLEFVDALFLAKTMLSSEKLKDFVESVILEIKRGKSISEAFSAGKAFPEIFHHMLKVGEETGSLKEIFEELYNIYDEKFKSTTKRVLSLLEPAIITFTGLMIGFIVISLILTVMSVGVIRL